jgi:hypothetical protein
VTRNIEDPKNRRSAAETNAPYGDTQFVQNGYGTPPAGNHAQQNYGPQQFAQYPPNYGAPQRSNGLATAGLVVGIIAAVFSFIPVIGVVAWGLAPIALVLSVVGLVKSGRARNGRGKSIAGIVLSVVALIMCILYTALFTSTVNNVQQQSTAVHSVTYKVTTAKGSKITASYGQSQSNNLASATVGDVASPWSVDAQVSGFMGPNVTASLSPDINNMGRSDTITCTIVEDGAQVAQNSATGPNASVTCMK